MVLFCLVRTAPFVSADQSQQARVSQVIQDVRLMEAKLRFDRCTEPRMIKRAADLLDFNSVATISATHPSSR